MKNSPCTWQERKSKIKHQWIKPLIWIDWQIERLIRCFRSSAFFNLLTSLVLLVTAASLIFGVWFYYEHRHYQAWQVISLAQGKSGDGGRLQALQELNKDRIVLAGVDVANAYLVSINLQGANLQGANMVDTNLQGTNLSKANLQGVDLQKANLYLAFLQGANLLKANLREANLQKAILWEANLQGTNLRGANLQKTHLQGANLREANLQNAILWEANLQGTNLQEADLQEADLKKTNLRETNLQGANLREADFQEADLRGAKGITIHELLVVKTLYKAKLDSKIEEQIKTKYFPLLEEPKDK